MADDKKTINIADRVALGEREAEVQYLKSRNLLLAQLLEDTAAQLEAERQAHYETQAELGQLKAGASGEAN